MVVVMIESIEKLREVIGADASQLGYTNGSKKMLELLDEIERKEDGLTHAMNKAAGNWAKADKELRELKAEVSERYVELPADMDGSVINIGDDTDEGVVVSMQIDSGGWTVVTQDKNGNLDNYLPHHLVKYEKRTIEDVLLDCCIEADERYGEDCRMEIIAKYADEIRGLL